MELLFEDSIAVSSANGQKVVNGRTGYKYENLTRLFYLNT